MAGEFFKMKTGIIEMPKFMLLQQALGLEQEPLLFGLYKVASWFQVHGKFGQMDARFISSLDRTAGIDGLHVAMQSVGWLRVDGGKAWIRGFAESRANRKPLGPAIRSTVLSAGSCVACGSCEDLEIDHIVPVSRGGTSAPENLQVLCETCNRDKGRKTMTEFMAARRND